MLDDRSGENIYCLVHLFEEIEKVVATYEVLKEGIALDSDTA